VPACVKWLSEPVSELASACAHSMSSDSSRAQSELLAGRPDGWSISKQAPAWVRDVRVDRAG
jgi:hypothetical protein